MQILALTKNKTFSYLFFINESAKSSLNKYLKFYLISNIGMNLYK